MLGALLITLREGFEASLIVGTVLAMLRRLEQGKRAKDVWAGVGVAVALSVLVGLALQRVGVAFEGRGEQIFEGTAMLFAAVVLTWMIFWMQRESRRVRSTLESRTQRAVSANSAGMLFGLAFLAVVREGLETVLFITAAAFGTTPRQALLGGIAGLAVAVALGWAIYVSQRKLNVRAFFRLTGILLIFFAAGLLARGVHELQEAALLPVWVEHLYNLNPILDENGTFGSLLQALFGYSGSPSLLQTAVYVAYLATVWLVSSRGRRLDEGVAPQLRR